MATVGEELALRFEAENRKFMDLVRSLSTDQWVAVCADEGWTAGVVAHHIAESHGVLGDLVQTIANGDPVPVITADFVNGLNADHAARAANCTKEETLKVADEGGARVARTFRSLSDEQLLSNTATMPFAGGEVSAAVISDMLVVGHIAMHQSSIEQVIALSSS